MRAEIISVGTELLLGHVVNTDAAFLGRELALLGFDLHHTSVVGDNAERLAEVLAKAIGRSDLVITTGGLGPTLDDLTKKTVASVLARPLVHDDATTAALKEFFGTRPYDGNQEAQAYFPEGATIFVNNHGTAPGCAVTADNGCLVMLFPGPPRELEPMFRDMALPILEKKVGASIVSFMVRTFDIGEGNAATRLGSLCEQQNPTVATYLGAHNEVFARVTAKAATAEEPFVYGTYPSLLHDRLYIQLSEKSRGAKAIIRTTSGREVMRTDLQPNDELVAPVEVSHLAPGVYKLEVVSPAGTYKQTIMKGA